MDNKTTPVDDELNITKILKESSLAVRLRVSNQMSFIDLITELGYRENKMWTDAEDELFYKLCRLSDSHTKRQLQQIKEWEADGRPQ